jgi:predicted amidohydrolase YtcJ
MTQVQQYASFFRIDSLPATCRIPPMQEGEGLKLFYGGTIYTADPRRPYVEAVAVRGPVIAAAGSLTQCRSALGPSHEPVDLKGGTLLPGFCDSHMHPLPTIFYSMNCNLSGVRDMDELIARLRGSEAGTGQGDWVIGLNFDEQGMSVPRIPGRSELDRVSKEKPVIVIKHDGHSVIASTLAMEKAGITPETPTPRGGYIERDVHGQPLGIFSENAKSLILNHMALPGIDHFIAGGKKAFDLMLSQGITSLGLILESDANGPSGTLGSFDIPAMELLRPVIRQSLNAFFITRDILSIEKARASLCSDPSRGDRVAGLKIISDGTFGSCTACMEEPFSDRPGEAGFMLRGEEEIYHLMVQAHTAGLQIAVHAIGDKANRTCLQLYGRLLASCPGKDHRHRIEHASIMDSEMLRQVRELGLVLCVQPMFIHSDMPYLEKRIGKERMACTYPFRSMLEQGIPLAAASDSPVETQDVLAAIECAVTREGYIPSQTVTVAQAIGMYTLGAAYAQFEEGIKGSITPGKRADLVILERNPFRVDPAEIHGIKILGTYIQGSLAYAR